MVFETYDDGAERLMNAFFGTAHLPARIYNVLAPSNAAGDPDFVNVSTRELNHVMSDQAANKTLGYDLIDGTIAKNLSQVFPNLLKNFLLSSCHCDIFQQIGKRELSFFFRKRNKNPASLRAYRPIILLFLRKLLEKITKLRIMTDLESEGILAKRQYVFSMIKQIYNRLFYNSSRVNNIVWKKVHVGIRGKVSTDALAKSAVDGITLDFDD